ncbi:MAG: hypothetical protein AAFS11_07220 [Planctomycetota bacterium]
MFNQCTPSFNQFGFGGFQPFGFQSFNQPFNWNGFAPFNGFNWNGFNGFQGQNWNNQFASPFNNQFNGYQNFDWSAFYAGCSFGFQNACNWFNANGQNFNSQNNTQNGHVPANFGPFGFFPYGPFPFNGFNQQNVNGNQNQQAA